MKKHTSIYLKAFGYGLGDFIPCEISGNRAVDVNHIEARGMGGNPAGDKDRIENLMAMTRELHLKHGDVSKDKAYLYKVHKEFMQNNGVKFDEDWINQKILQR